MTLIQNDEEAKLNVSILVVFFLVVLYFSPKINTIQMPMIRNGAIFLISSGLKPLRKYFHQRGTLGSISKVALTLAIARSFRPISPKTFARVGEDRTRFASHL